MSCACVDRDGDCEVFHLIFPLSLAKMTAKNLSYLERRRGIALVR